MPLTLNKPAPRWLDLPYGVRVEVEPLTTARATAARNEALRRAGAITAEAEAAAKAGQEFSPGSFTGANASAVAGISMEFEIEALARYGIRRWEGVHGPDGQPLPVTPEACEALAQHPELGVAFWAAYRKPIDDMADEGNGSAPSASSDGAAGASTAPDAKAAPETETASPPAPAENAPPS
jgi:hypothetical protein